MELCNSTYGDVNTITGFSIMRNFASLSLRVGGLIAGSGLFVVAMAWTIVQITMLFMQPWEADRYLEWLTPVLAAGGATMGIGLQAVAIGTVIKCALGAFRYLGLMVGLKDPALAA